jgi:hypothetical protein
VGLETHFTVWKGDIRAARIIVFWIDVLSLGLWSQAGKGWVNAISLRRVWELSVEVRKEEDQRGDEDERQDEAMMWACYGHIGCKSLNGRE